MTRYWFERLFDGATEREACVLEVDDDGRVAGLREHAPRLDDPARNFEGLAAPGLLDMQVNGAGGVLFNASPTRAGLETMARALAQAGVCHFLPTVLTDAPAVRRAARDAVEQTRGALPELLGVHYEGPHIDPGKRGVHRAEAIEALDAPALAALLELRGTGRDLITLAPEHVDAASIEALSQAGFAVFMGHTNARFADVARARAAGARGFTHFFNAMSPLHHREPGAVGAGLLFDDLWLGLIADGHHVAPAVLRMLAERRGCARLCLVSDGMPTIASERSRFSLYGETIELREGRLTNAEGRLAGAHLPLARAVKNAVEMMGVSVHAALRMASAQPAQALGVDAELGTLRPGMRASVSVFGPELEPRATLVDGQVRWRVEAGGALG